MSGTATEDQPGPGQGPRRPAAHPSTPTAGPPVRPAPSGTPPSPPPSPLGRFLARAAALTAALTAAGSLLGLVRDQAIAHLFGADGDTDAFLVAWTVPELAATLLIEDAMALVLVPAFSLALSRRTASGRDPAAPDPVRELAAATFPRLFAWLAAVAALLLATAPVLVRALAPGLADPGLAVTCTRLTAVAVVTFGIAGYLSAALRAHDSFVPPAAIYVAYNLGICATMLALHSLLGVRAAAVGVAVGGALMVLVQLPSFLRRLNMRRPHLLRTAPDAAPPPSPGPAARIGLLSLGGIAPVLLFALGRQAQVLVERHFGSSLSAGAISHLNYAQKVAQMPMVLSLMICTVTFPAVARAVADGDADRARLRVERDLALAAVVVLLGAAYVVGYAPQIIELLFQRGEFDASDTAATASVMRVYSLGLLGHSLVGALVRPFFSAARPTWYPAAVMAAGLLITVVASAAATPYWGIHGIAAANAAGITTTACLLLRGLGTRVIAIRARRVAGDLGRLTLPAVAAAAAGWTLAPAIPHTALTAAVGALAVPAVFVATAFAVRAPEVPQLIVTLTRKLRHAR
ncbi:virulence factor MviN [Streptomyces sp. NBC_01795]|uniref:lipid II flippase MurJ n=1 Tax=Streptomyces sp. NBC_01795 TaxID=2975943 RepID=UPI002DD9039C|nr:lipid II flippase MurJ [Streptomyces sp. NBC_01795]WSA90348.1 virulence factor MviN [Streptomyces sp. NBC_01795]